MQKSEFKIGEYFYTETGKWMCTDIGTRTIAAIKIDSEDLTEYYGPPYKVVEHVFDEYDFPGLYLTTGIWQYKLRKGRLQ